jgi:hypothetical protein
MANDRLFREAANGPVVYGGVPVIAIRGSFQRAYRSVA